MISYCHFLTGLFEEVCGDDLPAFCCKPTINWTNAPSFIHAWGDGRMFCGWASQAMRARGLGHCFPCEWIGQHEKNGGGVAQAARGAAGRASAFPYEYAMSYAQLMSQSVGERRRETETYARSDQTITQRAELHSVEAFCRTAGNWERR